MFSRFNSTRCATQCKLCITRVKMMRNKKQTMLKAQRKEVADLLRNNKQGNARIRVEAVIREILLLEAYEILELFLELLSVRVKMVEQAKDVPPDMIEALGSLVYAAQRLQDFPELAIIRGLLGNKFGKEFVNEASSDVMCRKWQVNENLIRCLSIDAPAPEDKLAQLSEIAQEYNVEWDSHRAALEMLPSEQSMAETTPSYQETLLDITGPNGMPQARPPVPQGNWGPPIQPPQPRPPPPAHAQAPAQPPAGARPPSEQRSPFDSVIVRGPGAASGGYAPPTVPAARKTGDTFSDALHSVGRWKHNQEHPDAPARHRRTTSGNSINSSSSDTGDKDPEVTSPVSPGPSLPPFPEESANGTEYPDATSAAMAARQYSQHAQAAAESAARHAAGRSAGGGSGGGGQLSKASAWDAPTAGGTAQRGAASPTYIERSAEDIQRDYDAALGPPSKKGAFQEAEAEPPSAPPATEASSSGSSGRNGGLPPSGPSVTSASPLAPPAPSTGLPHAGSTNSLGLPDPPSSGQAARPPVQVNELDELAKRFEALKRR
ncbi:hypothetical protein WJX72_005542 [[Myrmecia] bisecta]|uniref:IST1 homolog n=1 Tax=[Myrmecia] bisecta TaxID=41462 RepID=A0AAW1PSU8_9CHLO